MKYDYEWVHPPSLQEGLRGIRKGQVWYPWAWYPWAGPLQDALVDLSADGLAISTLCHALRASGPVSANGWRSEALGLAAKLRRVSPSLLRLYATTDQTVLAQGEELMRTIHYPERRALRCWRAGWIVFSGSLWSPESEVFYTSTGRQVFLPLRHRRNPSKDAPSLKAYHTQRRRAGDTAIHQAILYCAGAMMLRAGA